MINGDKNLGILEKIFFFPQCITNGWKGTVKNLLVKKVKLTSYEIIHGFGSPSRRLSNMFWDTVNWKNLSDKLIGGVKILDLGCGAGKYGLFFKKIIGENFSSYTGIDINRRDNLPKEFTFITDKGENAFTYINDQNCITSQSALEHFEDDIEALSLVTKQLILRGKPFIQIHIVPASAGLFLWLWHGRRYYSKKNLGHISKLLLKEYDVKSCVVPLGSVRCFISHLTLITLLKKILSSFNKHIFGMDNIEKKIEELIKKSVIKERSVNESIPSMWALVIASNHIEIDSVI